MALVLAGDPTERGPGRKCQPGSSPALLASDWHPEAERSNPLLPERLAAAAPPNPGSRWETPNAIRLSSPRQPGHPPDLPTLGAVHRLAITPLLVKGTAPASPPSTPYHGVQPFLIMQQFGGSFEELRSNPPRHSTTDSVVGGIRETHPGTSRAATPGRDALQRCPEISQRRPAGFHSPNPLHSEEDNPGAHPGRHREPTHETKTAIPPANEPEPLRQRPSHPTGPRFLRLLPWEETLLGVARRDPAGGCPAARRSPRSADFPPRAPNFGMNSASRGLTPTGTFPDLYAELVKILAQIPDMI